MIRKILFLLVLYLPTVSCGQEQIQNVIMPINYFVNHVTQLEQLKNNLEKYRRASIVGISGMGKTQLARNYIISTRDNYNLIWTLDCNQDLSEEFSKLAKNINHSVKSALLSEDSLLAKKEVLDYLTHKNKWLLIFDNLKVNENAKIKEFIEWEHNGNIIFCSQDSENLPHTIDMPLLGEDNSFILANNLLENQDPKIAKLLAKEMKGYPMLIVQGSQLFNRIKGLKMDEYREKIKLSSDKIGINIALAIEALKPSAVKLLYQISLINNQKFSKDFLAIIIENVNTLDDDLYNLSKFNLISSVKSDQDNFVYEMHDLIAQSVLEHNNTNIKTCLEEIIDKVCKSIPRSVIKGHLFRAGQTIKENIEIIVKNGEIYNINPYKIMALNSHLIIQYVNSNNNYQAEQLVDWIRKKEEIKQLKLSSMNNNTMSEYGVYLELAGLYYSRARCDYIKALEYLNRSKEVFDRVKGFESLKYNVFYQLAIINITLGDVIVAESYLLKLREMLAEGLVDKDDVSFIHISCARLFLAQSKYQEALEQANSYIFEMIKKGIKTDDLFLTNVYLIKTDILNALLKYKEAHDQATQIYNMHKNDKKEDHIVFGRIYAVMARAELGIGDIIKSHHHIEKSISILKNDEYRNIKGAEFSHDLDLANSYVIQGDILFEQNMLQKALESYREAQNIYLHGYNKENRKNISSISYLYKQGAKAACKKNDQYYFESFVKPQIEDFGADHSNTALIINYCKQYNMTISDHED